MRDRRGVEIARGHAGHRVLVLAGEQHLVVLVRHQALGRKKRARRQVARVGRGRGVRDLLAFQVGEFLERAVGLYDHPQLVALRPVRVAADADRNRARDVDRERGVARGHGAQVHAARAHRLDCRGTGKNVVETDSAPDAGRQMLDEGLHELFEYRRVFERRVGEEQGLRVFLPLWIARRIREQVAVLVAVERVELAAAFATLLRLGGEHGQCKQGGEDCAHRRATSSPWLRRPSRAPPLLPRVRGRTRRGCTACPSLLPLCAPAPSRPCRLSAGSGRRRGTPFSSLR